VYARSVDARAEYQGIFSINKNYKLAFGTTGQNSVSNPYTSQLGRRFDPTITSFQYSGQNLSPQTPSGLSDAADSISTIDSLTWIPRHTVYNIAAFTHFLYKSNNGKLNLEAALRGDYNSIDRFRFTPKLGVVYRPNNSLRLVANYSRGHRAPRSYHLYNNFWQSTNELIASAPPGSDLTDYMKLSRSKDSLKTEKLEGIEFRMDVRATKSLKFGLRYYAHWMQNRIIRQIHTAPPPPPVGTQFPASSRVGVGYFNTESYSFLNSAMLTIAYDREWENLSLKVLISYEYAKFCCSIRRVSFHASPFNESQCEHHV